jgi:hypothetical protein
VCRPPIGCAVAVCDAPWPGACGDGARQVRIVVLAVEPLLHGRPSARLDLHEQFIQIIVDGPGLHGVRSLGRMMVKGSGSRLMGRPPRGRFARARR